MRLKMLTGGEAPDEVLGQLVRRVGGGNHAAR